MPRGSETITDITPKVFHIVAQGKQIASLTSDCAALGIGLDQALATPGSRGVIFGSRGPGKLGHFFNGVNQKGAIRYLDGQAGGAANLGESSEFFFLKTNT